jgi:hypothetical protein
MIRLAATFGVKFAGGFFDKQKGEQGAAKSRRPPLFFSKNKLV